MHYMMLLLGKVPAPREPYSIFQEQMSPTSPSRVPGAPLISPRDLALTHRGQGTTYASPCNWAIALGPSQRHRDNGDRGFLEGRRNVMSQHNHSHSRGPGSQKPLSSMHPHSPPRGLLLPFPSSAEGGQLGLTEVERHSHDQQPDGGQVSQSIQWGRGSAHLVKRRSSTCWGVPKAL